MQETPMANRLHIGVFGRRNAGKSSLINALTNQQLTLVSEVAGTTTDPVYKAMELLPLGPVVIIDTAGIDDTGSLGEMRVKKTREVMRKTELAVVVIDSRQGISSYEKELLTYLKEQKTEVIVTLNKIDLIEGVKEYCQQVEKELGEKVIPFSAENKLGLENLKKAITARAVSNNAEPPVIGDLINPGEIVVLVTPIDSAAPKGRLILPQVQTIRDILDHDGVAIVCKEEKLSVALSRLREKPGFVVTDSQVFQQVDRDLSSDILMTSFSILFARYKGDLKIYLKGARKLQKLGPESKILIVEACTHHRQADDIGTVKIPHWLKEKFGSSLQFSHLAGRDYPDNLTDYDLVIHCGACMLNRQEMLSRLREADKAGVSVINYGMAIAQLHGILNRALKPFPGIYQQWLEELDCSNCS